MELLTRKGALLNEKNKAFLTPLHLAAELLHYDAMEVLLKQSAKVNALDSLGQTPLHRCARDEQAVRLLLSYAADTNIVSLEGLTAAQLASDNVLKLLKNPPDSETHLLEAAKAGDLDTVRRIVLNNPISVNCRDLDGRHSTPLHFAAGFNRVPVVQFLLEHGAEVYAADKGGLVPLHNACSYGHYEVTELLVKHGANVNVSDLWKLDVCLALLQHGANHTIRNSEQKTPLELADEATRPVLTGEYRKDELLEAARSGAEDRLLALLTPLNVNCHASDGRRSTPLHLAAGYNRIGIVEILLANGADVHAKDKGGLVPLHNACSYGHFDVTKLLIQAGANVNANDLWAFTPLHEAASKSRVEVCSLLLSRGADPTLLNCHSKSAIDAAPTRELRERIACEYSMDFIPKIDQSIFT